ncbi:ABC-type transport auxiliary lipoprotein family protein [Coralliovum pocilloporae]|uniref:ABC-type transport auxiliary lipoprotein family protein n=1 Tax=Coralliovum pocilloporae TaxID=3066369 RepID=UPI003307AB4B
MSRAAVVTALLATTAGCAALLGGEERATFDVVAPASFDGLQSGTSAQLLIKEPSAVSVLDSERIAIRSDAFEVSYLAKAQWTDSVPKLVQARMIQTFENSGRTRAIGRPGEGLLIDYQLAFDVRAFEAVSDGDSRAVVRFGVKIINERNGRLVGQRVFEANAPVAGHDADLVVEGINQAFNTAADDIVRWVLQRI